MDRIPSLICQILKYQHHSVDFYIVCLGWEIWAIKDLSYQICSAFGAAAPVLMNFVDGHGVILQQMNYNPLNVPISFLHCKLHLK